MLLPMSLSFSHDLKSKAKRMQDAGLQSRNLLARYLHDSAGGEYSMRFTEYCCGKATLPV